MHTAALLCLAGLLLSACGAPTPDATPSPEVSADSATLDDSADPRVTPLPLEDAITEEGLLAHLDALQAIADAHGGARDGDSAGFAASVDYAAEVLRAAGYAVTRVPFTWQVWSATAALGIDGVSVDPAELSPLVGTVGGDVTAPVIGVDLVLPPTPQSSSTSGCEASDFADFPAGAIALVQRGTCTFDTKAAHAEAAGAVAVIVFNEGQPGRTDAEQWVLDPPAAIPVLGTSFGVGEALVGASVARVTIEVATVTRASENLLADTPSGDPARTVVVGAHLDSVAAGPGIHDNGSGSALVIELAVRAAAEGWQPANRIRFALWGAEELGLVGSLRWLEALGDDEIDGILANLNYDMIASPNGARFVYDGDGSAAGFAGPPGSETLEALHAEWFAQRGLAWAETPMDGRSDYFGFVVRGIPAGGLFAGAESLKRASEVADFGGEASAPYDPCYHRACDTRDNIDERLFFELSRAAAYVTRRLGAWEGPLGGARAAWPAPGDPPVSGVESCHGERPPRF